MGICSTLGGLCRTKNRCAEDGIRQSVHKPVDFDATADTAIPKPLIEMDDDDLSGSDWVIVDSKHVRLL